jgi:hypothetical protein
MHASAHLGRDHDPEPPAGMCLHPTYKPAGERVSCIQSQTGTRLTPYVTNQVFSKHTRHGDWLGARFRRYARRIRFLSTADRTVDSVAYPIRSSSWMPVIPEPEPAKWFAHSRLTTSSLHHEVLRAWCAYSTDFFPLFPDLKSVQSSTTCSYKVMFLGPALTGLTTVT